MLWMVLQIAVAIKFISMKTHFMGFNECKLIQSRFK